jgi:signal transduction histidine kinase/CheY-like chemotaxis protein
MMSAPTAGAHAPSRLSSLQTIARTRRGELGVRLLLALIGASALAVLGAPPPAAAVWCIVTVATQAACLAAFRRFEDDADDHPPSRIELAVCHTTMFVACLWYSGLGAPLWFEGGLGGKAFAVLWVSGGLVHVTLHMPHDRPLLATALSAHAIVLLGLPAAEAAIGSQLDSRGAGIALLGPVLFVGHLVIALRKNGAMSAMLRSARERALEGKAAAEAASEAASRCLKAMSDELRGPLSGALDLAGQLQRSELAPAQRRCAEALEDAGRMLLSHLSDILDLSRDEADSVVIEEEDVDLRRLATSVAELWRGRAEEKGLRLRAVVDADAPALVRADGRRLGQIVSNLLANAVKLTEAGEIRLHVDAFKIDARRAKVWISVMGAGRGAEAGRALQPSEPTTQPDAASGGAGLGLALSRSLARRMGGEVTASSRAGPRFTFEATFPVARWPVRSRSVVIAFEGPEGGEATIRREDFDIELEDVTGVAPLELEEDWERLAYGRDSTPRRGGPLDSHTIVADQVFAEARLALPPPPAGGDCQSGAELAAADASSPASPPPSRPPASPSSGGGGGASPPIELVGLVDPGEEGFGGKGGAQSAARLAERERSLKALAPLPSGLCICVVEDHPLNRRVIEAALHRLDCELAFAVDGEDALAQTEARAFDVIFMDLQMPVLDGFEVTRRIRSGGVNAQTPIIGLTANVLPGVRERCIAAGMDDFIAKPVDLEALYGAIARSLRRGDDAASAPAAGRLLD